MMDYSVSLALINVFYLCPNMGSKKMKYGHEFRLQTLFYASFSWH